MDTKETIGNVIATLKRLFEDGGELKGFNDWDCLIGCVVALENIYNTIQTQELTQAEGE